MRLSAYQRNRRRFARGRILQRTWRTGLLTMLYWGMSGAAGLMADTPARPNSPQPPAPPVELVDSGEPQRVFGGGERAVSVVWRNTGDQAVKLRVSTRLWQTTSATAAPLRAADWKSLELLAGQTVMDSGRVLFPSVRAETRFLLQWLQATNIVLGVTEIWVYPTNLLQELSWLAGEVPIGVYDPRNEIKPALEQLQVEYTDLEESAREGYSGRVAIFGPFESRERVSEIALNEARALCGRGIAIVWIFSPGNGPWQLGRSIYEAAIGQKRMLVATRHSDLVEEPEAQLGLLAVSRWAVKPHERPLPELKAAP